MLLRTGRSSLRYPVALLILVGLFAARGRPARRGWFVLTLVGVYSAMLFALTASQGYVSRRHALPPLVPLFGYMAIGAVAIGAWIARSARWPRAARPIAAGLVACLAVAEVWTQREPRREEERAARSAAEWLRANAAPGGLLADRVRLGYYAGMPYITLGRIDAAILRPPAGETPDRELARELDRELEAAGVRYILLDEPSDIETLREVAGDRLRPLHRAVAGGREAWVFERVAAASP
jgi:hypothetical protein